MFAFVGATLMVEGGSYRGVAKRQSEVKLMTTGVGLMILGLLMVGAVAAFTGIESLKSGGSEPRAVVEARVLRRDARSR